MLPSLWLLPSTPTDNSGGSNCKDGVCALPTKGNDEKLASDAVVDQWKAATEKEGTEMPSTGPSTVALKEPENLPALIAEMEKLGWGAKEAKEALIHTGFDVSKAAEHLDVEGERKEKASKLSVDGRWTLEAARASLSECNWNTTEAQILLETEEASIGTQFSNSVADMVDKGWDELVARQALLTQWTIDQRKAAGLNTTTSRDVLDQIKPTLKRSNTTNAKNAQISGNSAGKGGTEPKPAKKEDCVFEVNSNNFQKVVLDSPVPVILDIYADWCGPCKQLGPVLENAAMKSGGMFRLAKVNSDNERGISEMLGVTGKNSNTSKYLPSTS